VIFEQLAAVRVKFTLLGLILSSFSNMHFEGRPKPILMFIAGDLHSRCRGIYPWRWKEFEEVSEYSEF
jgi:hypothetical protein